jgi:uncharacterized membrane protein
MRPDRSVPTPLQAPRFDAVDALRGLAMVWMTVFHFCFDLNQMGYLRQNFYTDPHWTLQRVMIVSLFLFCAGLGQAAAMHWGQTWRHFWRRWRQIAVCALVVSVASYQMFPNSFIYFGVLHGIAVMLIIVRLTAGWGGWLWGLGALAIATKFIAAYALDMRAEAILFNSNWLNWLGLITHKPVTEDYAPLTPWLGVMWWGVAAGAWLLRNRPSLLAWQMPLLNKPLAALGRWSLSYYMVHQPVIVGLLIVVGWAGR